MNKRALYAHHGVGHYWLLDPTAQTLEVLRLDPVSRDWANVGTYDATAVARIAPLEALELEVGTLFSEDA